MMDQWRLGRAPERQRDRFAHLRSELIGVHVVVRRIMERDATAEVPIVVRNRCQSLLSEATALFGNAPAVTSAVEVASELPVRAVDLFTAVAHVLRLIPLPPLPSDEE